MHNDVSVSTDGGGEVSVDWHIESIMVEHVLILDHTRTEIACILQINNGIAQRRVATGRLNIFMEFFIYLFHLYVGLRPIGSNTLVAVRL